MMLHTPHSMLAILRVMLQMIARAPDGINVVDSWPLIRAALTSSGSPGSALWRRLCTHVPEVRLVHLLHKEQFPHELTVGFQY